LALLGIAWHCLALLAIGLAKKVNFQRFSHVFVHNLSAKVALLFLGL
jgi:hypothetical protein